MKKRKQRPKAGAQGVPATSTAQGRPSVPSCTRAAALQTALLSSGVASPDGNAQGPLLLSLGPLVTGRLVKRPSAIIKTPYVADVALDTTPGSAAEAGSPRPPQQQQQQHQHQVTSTPAPAAPAGVHSGSTTTAGLSPAVVDGPAHACKGNKRASKATQSIGAAVDPMPAGGASKSTSDARLAATGGPRPAGKRGKCGSKAAESVAAPAQEVVLAHAPSLDCAGMVLPGARVYMSCNKRDGVQSTTKTSHTVQVVEDVRDDAGRVTHVGYHPSLAERITKAALSQGLLQQWLGPHAQLETQRTYGSTRVDFVLRHPDGSCTLLEVKNVVCADFPEGQVPADRPKVGLYTSPAPPGKPWAATALFPHGSPKPGIKVVSDRAIKHVHELTTLHTQGVARAALLFLVNRQDCATFRPCDEADPLFANIVKHAQSQGVQLLAHDVLIDVQTGDVRWGKPLPVVFSAGVTGEVDPARLQQVLHFNQTDPRKRRTSSGSLNPAASPTAKKPRKRNSASNAADGTSCD